MPVVRLALVLLAGVCGAVVAVLGTYAHLVVVGSGRWPIGLVLALALTASAGRLAGALPLPTGGPPAVVVGWLAVVLVASTTWPQGHPVILGNLRGWAWLVLGFVVLLATAVVPTSRGQRRQA